MKEKDKEELEEIVFQKLQNPKFHREFAHEYAKLKEEVGVLKRTFLNSDEIFPMIAAFCPNGCFLNAPIILSALSADVIIIALPSFEISISGLTSAILEKTVCKLLDRRRAKSIHLIASGIDRL